MDDARATTPGSYVTSQGPGRSRTSEDGTTSHADVAPVTGALAWWLAFYLFIPVLGFLVWVLVVISTYREERKNPVEAVRVNVRNGLNWMLTYIAVQLVLFALVVAPVAVGVESRDGGAWAGLAASAVLLGVASWGTLAFITAIMGGQAADRGVGFRTVFAIPFVRSS